MSSPDTPVAVIGGGLVGCAVLHALARRGVGGTLLEAEPGLALGASGANSGILHTGFDSAPGELETQLILRSAELRGQLAGELGLEVLRCGARMRPRGEPERLAVAELAANAARNGVEVRLSAEGVLDIPGEAIIDPTAYTEALAAAAGGGGATVLLGAAVVGLRPEGERGIAVEVGDGPTLHAGTVVNCAGLFADRIARLVGDGSFAIYPRKGEFLVFGMPPGAPLERILLPVPSERGKGVLLFPTLAGELVAGPTAREREDKRDWSVEADAAERILERLGDTYPALGAAEPIGAYAGLRPAGAGVNYLIEFSRCSSRLLHVAAIRSTGLSASLGIGEHVTGMLERRGLITTLPARALPAPARDAARGVGQASWWERAARWHAEQAERAEREAAPG
jgi:glycerol-3-phosphate dehydrogenase